MTRRLSAAVVQGASIAGLLAARALSHHFERVILVERDPLPAGTGLRRGVPQAAHAHGLLHSGYLVLDRYFPGMMDALAAQGARRGDVVGDFLWFQYGHWKLRRAVDLPGIVVSRGCLEAAVRERVRALPNVDCIEEAEGVRLLFDRGARRVRGLTVRRAGGAEEAIEADLVVDAGGRGSAAPRWLEAIGFPPPREAVVRIDVGYASRMFERRPGDFYDSIGGVVAGTPPASKRSAAVLAVEGDRWLVTLVGSVGDYPPGSEGDWPAFAASLPVPIVHDLVASARPLGGIATYRFPANRRRLYERMKAAPAGFLVIGDALCSFNPLYGQGMSVAAREAEALDHALAEGLDRLWERFYARARRIVDIPWTIATGEDLRHPEVEGRRAPGHTVVNRYLERVHAAASLDPLVCRKFFNVLNLLEPPTALMSPRIAWHVLSRRAPSGPGSPWGAAGPPKEREAAGRARSARG